VENGERFTLNYCDASQYSDEEDTVYMPEDQAKDYVKRLINERKNSHLPEKMNIPQDSTGYDKLQQGNVSDNSTGNATNSWLIY
jgi:hypothetical protein